MRRNARRAIVIAVLFTAVAGAGFWIARTPSMQVASVSTESIILEAGAQCGYSIWLNHTPDCNDCRYYDGTRVISATGFSKLTVYWNALEDVGVPESGDCFCGYWSCHDEEEWHGGELWSTVAWRVFLPLVMKNNS